MADLFEAVLWSPVITLWVILSSMFYSRIYPTAITSDNHTRKGGRVVVVKKESALGAPASYDSDSKWDRVDSRSSAKIFKSFIKELSVMGAPSHPNIARFVGRMHGSSVWILVPRDPTKNVREFVQLGEWGAPKRVSLIKDIVSGLEYLYTREPPICHGDLNPVNILVNSSNRAVISNFMSTCSKITGKIAKDDRPRSPSPGGVGDVDGVSRLTSLKATFDQNTSELTVIGPGLLFKWTAPGVLDDGKATKGHQQALRSPEWVRNVHGVSDSPYLEAMFNRFTSELGAMSPRSQRKWAVDEVRDGGKAAKGHRLGLPSLVGVWDGDLDRVLELAFLEAVFNRFTSELGAKSPRSQCKWEVDEVRDGGKAAKGHRRGLPSLVGVWDGDIDRVLELAFLEAVLSQIIPARSQLKWAADEVRSGGKATKGHRLGLPSPVGVWDGDGASELVSPEVSFNQTTLELTVKGPGLLFTWAELEVQDNELQHLSSDMLSVGWICWEITTGEIPFDISGTELVTALHGKTGELPPIYNKARVAQARQRSSLTLNRWFLNPAANASKFRDTIGWMIPSVTTPSKASREARLLQSFINRLRVVGALSNPNITPFVRNMPKSMIGIIIPWEPTKTVREYVQLGELGVPERVSLIKDIVSGIEYLHTRKPPICHGDLNPVNILINSSNRAVISKFLPAHTKTNGKPAKGNWPGLPRPAGIGDVGEGSGSTSLKLTFNNSTSELTVMGPSFLFKWSAPEMRNNERQDLPSDIWSIGWICWEILTSKIPFKEVLGNDTFEDRIVSGKLPQIQEEAQLSHVLRLCASISACWCLNPAARIDVATFRKNISSPTTLVNTDDGVNAQHATLLPKLGRMNCLQNDTAEAEGHDHQEHSLSEELTRIAYASGPATEELIGLLQALGIAAPRAVRNKHKIYSILRVSRDICNHLMGIGTPSEHRSDSNLKALITRTKDYYTLLDALEEALLQVAAILPSEVTAFGANLYPSWSERRSTLAGVLSKLCGPPFSPISFHAEDIANDLFFDDCSWLSRLLHSGIHPEIATQFLDIPETHPVFTVTKTLEYLENQVKCGIPDEPTRELIIDIATLLAQTLASTSPDDDDDDSLQEKSSLPTEADRDRLVQALADSFSILDLHSTLQPSTANELAIKWRDVKIDFTSRRPSASGD